MIKYVGCVNQKEMMCLSQNAKENYLIFVKKIDG